MKLVVALFVRFHVGLLEAGSVAVVVGGVAQFSERAAWIVAGAAGLAKSMELDVRRKGPS